MLEEKKEVKTIEGITLDEAKKMVTNYVKKAARDSNGHIKETISVWFKLTHLAEIVRNLNAELDTSELGKETDGLRIYFANYGDSPPEDKPEYANQNTVVLVSTRAVKGKPDMHLDYFSDEKSAMPPENRGALCPPNKGCDCYTELIDPEDGPLCSFEI